MTVKSLFCKLKSRKGESLVESLAAILIFTMSSIAMYSMVTSAADINMTVKEVEKVREQEMLVAERGEGTPVEGSITMTMGSNSIATVPVYVYGEEGELFSYFADAPAGGAGG